MKTWEAVASELRRLEGMALRVASNRRGTERFAITDKNIENKLIELRVELEIEMASDRPPDRNAEKFAQET